MIAQIFISLTSWGFTVGYLVIWIENHLQNPVLLSQHQITMPADGVGPAQHTTTAGWEPWVPKSLGGPGLSPMALALPAQLPGLWAFGPK